jgi:sugar-specific transcriptional regulator TrmB
MPESYEDILISIGLSPNEAKIYRALLELKEASIGDISTYANIHRRNTYDAIERLIKKGLAYQILPKKVLTYAPVHPDKLKEIVEEKNNEFISFLPKLIKQYDRTNPSQAIYVYKGVGGLKNYIDLEIKIGKTIYGIGSKGSWFDPRIKNYSKKANEKYQAKKIKSNIIYDFELKKYPDIVRKIGKNFKFLPEEYSSESSIDIFGDYVAIYSGVNVANLNEDISIFILKDKTLAKDYLKWFNFMWNNLPSRK